MSLKSRPILLACLLVIMVGVGAGVWYVASRTQPQVVVQLSSAPFPLTVGQTTLRVFLTDAQGAPLEADALQVASTITQGGELTLYSSTTRSTDGEYDAAVTYPRMGRWTIDVTGTLPNSQNTFSEEFVVFVYPVAPFTQSIRTTYRSTREIDAARSANSEQEYWIVIQPGTDEMMMEGLAGNLIPNEILLQASGRNTLVIRNDDFADHNIGPFFVRAGETVRQQFTEPAVYEGTCSISHSDEIRIVVTA